MVSRIAVFCLHTVKLFQVFLFIVSTQLNVYCLHITGFKRTERHKWNNWETKHSFDFKDSKMLVNIHFKQHKKIVESSIISNYNTIKQGSFLSTHLLIQLISFEYIQYHLFKLVFINYLLIIFNFLVSIWFLIEIFNKLDFYCKQ